MHPGKILRLRLGLHHDRSRSPFQHGSQETARVVDLTFGVEDHRVLPSRRIGAIQDKEIGESGHDSPLVRLSPSRRPPDLVEVPAALAPDLHREQPLLRQEARRVDDHVRRVLRARLGLDVARPDRGRAVAGQLHLRRVQAGEVGAGVDAALAARLVVGLQDRAVPRGRGGVDVVARRGADPLAQVRAAGGHGEGGEDAFELPGEVDAVEARGQWHVSHHGLPWFRVGWVALSCCF